MAVFATALVQLSAMLDAGVKERALKRLGQPARPRRERVAQPHAGGQLVARISARRILVGCATRVTRRLSYMKQNFDGVA